jgi:NADPH-dependent glutamate synthase beta subunit-like oxidoreductase/NAD(P)H-flavin reductase
MPLNKHLKTQFNLDFSDLYRLEGLEKLDKKFAEFLRKKDSKLADNFFAATKFDSGLVIEVSRFFEDFIADLFDVKKENEALKKQHENLKQVYVIRREFVQRNISKKFSDADEIDGKKILENLQIKFDEIDELEIKIAAEISDEKNLKYWEDYTRWALYSAVGKKFHKKGALFILPQKTDPQNLIPKDLDKRKRTGFDLTDEGYKLNRVQAEAKYCIFCHKQNKDSCRSGMFDHATKELKIDSLGVELHGCPLDEKISEMNLLKAEGFSLAALSVACIDNPMIAGTGHRICNDCMKSCIYQKQEPVDIPQVETRILKDILALPYGFEIYSLLTRWNPLNFEKKLPQRNTGKKVLVCGLGPAGYTLAHYLLNDGHDVVAIDGLKIEPLNHEISGIDLAGNRTEFKPIKFLDEIYEPLSKRVIGGFGGVAEYGITVRWDKNFLKVIRLLLERRKNFRMFGGLRFGSSITDKIAFDKYGFDHVALCIGAGRPNIINIKNNFSKGVRAASDFLMSLQLTGSFKEELFTNLQVRMPAVVIGGGLTATDTACEVRAYYQVQVKKFAKKITILGREKVFNSLNEEEKIIAEEFLNHAEKLEQGIDDFLDVKILYRKKIQDSPAYRLNHQELVKALEEEVEFIENITPLEIEIDQFNHIKNLKTNAGDFPCRSLLIAAGTTPNLSPKLEDDLDFELEGRYFSEISADHRHYQVTHSARPKQFSVITKIDDDSKKAVSFFGDLHPNFEGNVVKAMASAKLGHEQVTEILQSTNSSSENSNFWPKINADFHVKIVEINRLSENVIEIFVKAPLLANQTKVGQIFRLQNYHSLANKAGDQLLAMEGVPVTALNIDRENGIISGVIVETGGSTSLIKNFKVEEPCIFMGPSGKPTEIAKNETVVFVGGGRGNQPLTALAEEFSKNGCHVIFFAGYRKNSFIVREDKMKKSCSELIISVDGEVPKEGYFQGSVTAAIENYFSKNSPKIDRIFSIGNNHMMHEVAKLRHEIPELQKAKISITSLNAPMQCMLKGVCSQCLQKRKNENGEMEYFYSCANQDQDSDRLDFQHLNNRCEQNSLAEKVSRMEINRSLG